MQFLKKYIFIEANREELRLRIEGLPLNFGMNLEMGSGLIWYISASLEIIGLPINPFPNLTNFV